MNKKILAVCINAALYRGTAVAAYSPFGDIYDNWLYHPISDEEFRRRVIANGKNPIRESRWQSSRFW